MVLCLAVAVLALAPRATAQPASKPLGPEFQVNTTTASSQLFPDVAVDSAGNFVVVWQSFDQGTFDWNVVARSFDASGNARSGEIPVNTWTTGDQDQAKVAVDAVGNFVVVWESEDQDDGVSDGVFLQLFDASGNPQGSELQVNIFTGYSHQRQPDVEMDPNGNFVVAWQSEHQLGVGAQFDVFARLFDASGNALSGEIQANTYTIDSQSLPEVGIDSAGNFVIAWQSFDQDGSSQGVFGRLFDAAGAAQGGEFQVNTFTSGSEDEPSVAMDADGDFVVAWESSDQDGSGEGVYGQRFDAAGYPQGMEFRVNSTTFSAQEEMSVGMDTNGNFLVAWEGSLQDGDGDGIFAQQFDASGTALGGEFQVNTHTSGHQRNPSVAVGSSGNFVIAWESDIGGSNEIRARRFLGPCSESLALTPGGWHLIGLPCDPPAGADTLEDVFGDDLDPLNYGATWVVYARDAGRNRYQLVALDEALEVGAGYWIQTTLSGRTITVEGTNVDFTVPASSELAGEGGGYRSPQLVGLPGDCQDAGLADGRFNLLGFPFRQTVGLAGALIDDDGVELSFPEAEAANAVSDQIWTWGGSAYQAADTCTPGLEAELSKWDGFWVDVCDTTSVLAVVMPAQSVDLACGGAAPERSRPESSGAAASAAEGPRTALGPGGRAARVVGVEQGGRGPSRPGRGRVDESWYLRLVASADGLSDPGNVLGELTDSVYGYDAHDLVELQPFGENWLTIVFPHLDWGDDSSEWYTSDYHGLRDPREWRFEVRSSEARTVTLTWAFTGDAKLVEKLERHMELVDLVTGESVPAAAGSYSFTMSGSERPFAWLGRRGGGGPPPR